MEEKSLNPKIKETVNQLKINMPCMLGILDNTFIFSQYPCGCNTIWDKVNTRPGMIFCQKHQPIIGFTV